MKPVLALLLHLFLLGLAACGAPSSLDLCHAGCDLLKRCPAVAPVLHQAAGIPLPAACDTNCCHNHCESSASLYSDLDDADNRMCTNAGPVRGAVLDCYQNAECGSVERCIGGINNTCTTY